MPTVSLTLEDSNRTILSNAYYKIIQDIVDTIKIPYGALVVLHKDSEVTLTDNKTNVSVNSSDNLPSTVSHRRIKASINENYNEDELTTTAVHQPSAYPIFQDHDIDVSIYPIYIKSDINIEFSYISPSKTEATRIRDDIRIRLSQTRNIDIHEIEYSILIPTIVEDFITDVYDLKNRLVPQSLEDYFREHSTKRIFPMTDMSNIQNTKLAIQEKQVRILGLFDFNSLPEAIEHDNENNNYKVSFNYKLSMDIPRAMVMRYPVMICNRPLPGKYLQFIEDKRVQSKEEYKRDLGYTNSLQALSHFEAHRQLENRVDIKLPINVPLFDEFNLRQGHKGYGIVASFLTQIDEIDNKSLFNLTDIDPFHIDSKILNYIKNTESSFITNPYSSFLYLGLHQDKKHFDNSILEIDSDFNIRSKVPLSLYKPTRVTLSIILDLLALDKLAIERLLNNPEILIIFINEYIRAYNNFKTEMSTTIIPDNTFYKTLIFIIYYYIKIDDTETLKALLINLFKDNLIRLNLSSILFNNYPELTRFLEKNEIIKPEKNKLNLLHVNIENYAIRSVMSNYVVSLRMEDLNK